VLRLARRIEELEAALGAQPPHQGKEGTGAEDQQGEAEENAEARCSPSSEGASPLPLQVSEEHLTQWRANVAAQRREVLRLRTQYLEVTEQLQRCHIGRGNWGTLVRQQRFLAREMEEQETELSRYERFVALVEQGATKEEACAQVLGEHPSDTRAEEDAPAEVASSDAPEAQAALVPAEPPPRLEGQQLRQALFATLARLFTTGDPRHIDLERGRFNTAIKKLTALDVQPEDVPVLQAIFQRLWPKATCTALGLANNLPTLMVKAQELGWQRQESALSVSLVHCWEGASHGLV
jgi:hypothetical protein